MKNIVTLFFIVCALQLFDEMHFSFAQLESPEIVVSKHAIQHTYTYERYDEVEKQCKSVLSDAAELSTDDSRFIAIMEQLRFESGDWWQDGGKYPILPFKNVSHVNEKGYFGSLGEIPLKLVSFWVTDIDPSQLTKKSVSVSGFLSLQITTNFRFGQWSSQSQQPVIQFWPGFSELSLPFQGIYTESRKKNGERVLCLLGSGMLPVRDHHSDDPWNWAKDSNISRRDDQILLVLRYPMKYALASRVIEGEMRSLNPKSNAKYFDDIHISSQLRDGNYDFATDKAIEKACAPYPYDDNLMKKNIIMYTGFEFCTALQEITRKQAFKILPNRRCNSTDEFCRKLGPFLSDEVINSTDGSFTDVRLFMQDVKCKLQRGSNKNDFSASVSAVFRAVSPLENMNAARKRSALNNMTMVAEGMWKSSSGQLCMIGCVGLVNPEKISYDSRICLYMPISFTLKQRSVLLGSISSASDKPSYFPLSFEMLSVPTQFWQSFRNPHPFYNYTKIASAVAFLEKNESFSFGSVVKNSLLNYPKLEEAETYRPSEALLFEDLSFQVRPVPNPALTVQVDYVLMDIISVNSFFGRDWWRLNGSDMDMEKPYHAKPEYTEKQLLVNVSASLSLYEQRSNNFSALFVEGIYDPHFGKMYLLGCRDIRAPWKVLLESMDLEDGLDCRIEVVVSYPSTTAQWLINPSAEISITSQRKEDEPFYFGPITLETMPIMYRRQQQDILLRKNIEGVLRILTLSLAVACISSQIFYINRNLESVPYISLVTLGVQSLGYTIPLVTGAETLFKRRRSESYDELYGFEKDLWFHATDYTMKLLVVVSLLLTLRLCQKVWKSRIKLLRQAPLEPHRVPSDKWVFIATLCIHLISYITVLVVHNSRKAEIQVQSYLMTSRASVLQPWEKDLLECVGVVEVFFLVPQIIGNLIWQIDCKPLRNFYFIGITMVRLLPHIYDFIRAPIANPYFVQDYDFVNPSMDFYSRFGDVAIPLIAFILAVVVYIQQRWNYEKLSHALIVGRVRLLPRASRTYQRLPSKSYEAELATTENNTTEHRDIE